jgi:hypothetical protein
MSLRMSISLKLREVRKTAAEWPPFRGNSLSGDQVSFHARTGAWKEAVIDFEHEDVQAGAVVGV